MGPRSGLVITVALHSSALGRLGGARMGLAQPHAGATPSATPCACPPR